MGLSCRADQDVRSQIARVFCGRDCENGDAPYWETELGRNVRMILTPCPYDPITHLTMTLSLGRDVQRL